MRAVRRRRMGDTLEQQERRATMIAEEEVLAEELMERITGAANA